MRRRVVLAVLSAVVIAGLVDLALRPPPAPRPDPWPECAVIRKCLEAGGQPVSISWDFRDTTDGPMSLSPAGPGVAWEDGSREPVLLPRGTVEVRFDVVQDDRFRRGTAYLLPDGRRAWQWSNE